MSRTVRYRIYVTQFENINIYTFIMITSANATIQSIKRKLAKVNYYRFVNEKRIRMRAVLNDHNL